MENSSFHDTEVIEVPQEFHPTCKYDSHRPFLWMGAQMVSEGITEYGAGDGSTELLYSYCKKSQKVFISFDNNREWANKFKHYHTQFIPEWGNPHWAYKDWMVFIDHAPGERRKVDIEIYLQSVNLIVIHDTEPAAEYVYGMAQVLNSFKYRIDLHMPDMPSTTMVSNFVDLNYLKGKKILGFTIE